MIGELYRNIREKQELRSYVIALKQLLKEEKERETLRKLTGNSFDVIMKCLVEEDPKVRKNAVAILGIMGVEEAVDVIYDAYEAEETLFVRAEYVSALMHLDCRAYLPALKERLEELRAMDAAREESKHLREERGRLEALLLEKEGARIHRFLGYSREQDVLLTTLPAFVEALAEEIPFRKKRLKSGVRTLSTDLHLLLGCRLWQEMLFVVHGESILPQAEEEDIARWLAASDLLEQLRENHSGEEPFRFRIGIAGALPKEENRRLTKATADAVASVFGGALHNSTSHYELELRLVIHREGKTQAFLKLLTIPDRRFIYRKHHVDTGMKPTLAAGIMALAKPYLKEYAQVLDPFCGVGTLLLERRFVTPVRSAYGIDTFGEAIQKARANAALTGHPVNYINRDFLDFTHEYLFDEVVTEPPVSFVGREEADRFYGQFFAKSAQLLTQRGRIFLCSREMGLVKKQLRLGGEFRLLKEICIQEKSGLFLFILEKK